MGKFFREKLRMGSVSRGNDRIVLFLWYAVGINS